jgi:adenosylmethionine-8-amino-7-oxononanoate aminotransferase
MIKWDTEALVTADKKFVWHPFTNMRDWCAPEHEPLVLVEGHGASLRDSRGREYIDGNSSIWTNIHGHNHLHINAAIRQQLDRIAHTSFLGFSNSPAIELAREIVDLFPKDTLSRVFYSDDGSTGIEVALAKLEKASVYRFSKWLSWRYGRRGSTRRGGAVSDRTGPLEFSGDSGAERKSA